MAAYTITEGTLKRKDVFNPRFNRRNSTAGPGYINTVVCCEIDNGVETQDIEFNVIIRRTDSEEVINTKISDASIIELAKYNV